MARLKQQAIEIVEILERVGMWTHDGDPEATAHAWIEAGFCAADVYDWLTDCQCYRPEVARILDRARVPYGYLCGPDKYLRAPVQPGATRARVLCEVYDRSLGARAILSAFVRITTRGG